MSYTDGTSSRFDTVKEMAAEFFMNVNSFPCHSGYTVRENLGTFYFGLENYYGENQIPSTDSYEDMKEKSKSISNDKRIIFHKEGHISINFLTSFDISDVPSYRRKYYKTSSLEVLNAHLPKWIYLWEHGEGKIFATFSAEGTTVRPSYDNCVVPEILHDLVGKEGLPDVVTFFPVSSKYPKGKVDSSKIIKRGPTIYAEDKPLSQHLSGKHYTEMAKARLDSDLAVRMDTKFATFRGIHTGLKHVVLEMYRPSIDCVTGPNQGLIRRLSVARFIEVSEIQKASELAASIASELPATLMQGTLAEMVETAQS